MHTQYDVAFQQEALHFEEEPEKPNSLAMKNNSKIKRTKGTAWHFCLSIANQERSAVGMQRKM